MNASIDERIHAGLPDWMAVAVPIGLGAGLRQGETSGLTVDRVHFLRRTLRVERPPDAGRRGGGAGRSGRRVCPPAASTRPETGTHPF